MDAAERRFQVARLVERIGVHLFLIGVMGYALGFLSARLSGLTEADQTQSTLGQLLVWLFLASTVGGLLVVLPLSSLLYRRARRLSPPDRADEFDPRSAFDRAELPGWIGWPLWAFVAAAALWLTYVLLRYGIPAYFARGH
jgi:hypothetical protein